MSKAIGTQGTKLYWSTDEIKKVTEDCLIGEVKGWSGPSESTSEIDVTHLTSEAKEYLIGLVDNGDLTLDINFIPDDAVQMRMRKDMQDRLKRAWCIQLTDTDKHQIWGLGYVKGFPLTGSANSAVSGSISIRITGKVTIEKTTP